MNSKSFKNKYQAKRTAYSGRVYHSKREAQYAQQLDLRKLAGEIKSITPQFRVPIVIQGTLICTYVVDFKVVTSTGEIELIEVKGYSTYAWQIKWKLLKALLPSLFPDAKLILVN